MKFFEIFVTFNIHKLLYFMLLLLLFDDWEFDSFKILFIVDKLLFCFIIKFRIFLFNVNKSVFDAFSDINF
jgi:hypothetical protein